jgi:hypothetical protein
LEYITISAPKINNAAVSSVLANYYVCEVYLSASKIKNCPIYGISPVDALCLASDFTSNYLKGLIKRGYAIGEAESKKP